MKQDVYNKLMEGTAIPAFPLALNEDKTLDELSLRTLVHYYVDAGVGGLAVGVHTTQFEIRDHGLYETVLTIAMEELKKYDHTLIKLAGVAGPTEQAIEEAKIAKALGYAIVLLSMGNLSDYSEEMLIERTKQVSEIIPVFGFYLQPSAGGRIMSYNFWKEIVKIENVLAIKLAPFNRYYSLDVIKAVMLSDRYDEIALYTGNDDNIVNDLLTTFIFEVDGQVREKDIVGGLLGHWSVNTKNSVDLFHQTKNYKTLDELRNLLTLGAHVTEMNAAFFDIHNNFKGSIAGINEVLTRQGLLKGNWCLEDKEVLSPGQTEFIDEVLSRYSDYLDNSFIKENLEKWKKLAQD